MHFIQNSWFAHNWIVLFLFICSVVSIVAYMNNRRKLFRLASYTLMLLFAFTATFLLFPAIHQSLSMNQDLLSSIEVGKSTEEKISTFSKIIDFIARILKNKIGN